jgi:hypothetical protein
MASLAAAPLSCPVCGCTLQPAFNDNYEVLEDSTDSLDCAICGSLEGLDVDLHIPRPKRTFSFRWSEGLVAPFIGARKSIVAAALKAAEVNADDHFFDLGCGKATAFLHQSLDTACTDLLLIALIIFIIFR